MANLNVEGWQFFVALGLLLISLELMTQTFYLLAVGLAFLVTGIFGFFVTSWFPQVVLLATNLTAVFFLFKKWRKNIGRNSKKQFLTNVDSLVGKTAIVSEEITGDKKGYVKLYGDRWQALSSYGEPISIGTEVTIEKVEGNKVFVFRREQK